MRGWTIPRHRRLGLGWSFVARQAAGPPGRKPSRGRDGRMRRPVLRGILRQRPSLPARPFDRGPVLQPASARAGDCRCGARRKTGRLGRQLRKPRGAGAQQEKQRALRLVSRRGPTAFRATHDGMSAGAADGPFPPAASAPLQHHVERREALVAGSTAHAAIRSGKPPWSSFSRRCSRSIRLR